MKDAYAAIIARDELVADAEQQRIVNLLQDLQAQLEQPAGGIRQLLQSAGIVGKAKPTRGLYLWGGVGRGKTFLMDLFYESLAIDKKRRVHFHRMMAEVHGRLRQTGNTVDPLDRVAADIARDTQVLCFDEFFVSDIADAMVLGHLLECLFARGVVLVTTSNSPPDRLYHGGLQRERFLPAIALLEQHCHVVEMDSGTDYRLRVLQQATTYLTPAGDDANRQLRQFLHKIAPGETVEARVLDILGREIRTICCGKGVAWFDFRELCEGPRSQNDYIEIARWYQTVIVSDIPVFTRELENSARRFISLVDEFYDRRVKLIVSAGGTVHELYQGKKLKFEFRRTASRLTEMQSEKYLHEAHLA